MAVSEPECLHYRLVDLFYTHPTLLEERELISPKISSNQGGPAWQSDWQMSCDINISREAPPEMPNPYWEYVCTCTIQGIWDKKYPQEKD